MNVSKSLFLGMRNTQKWMKQHGRDDEKYLQSQKNIEFSRELFKIWDEDESGNLEVDELTLPLIALGLSNDSSFVYKILRSIDYEKFKSKNERISIKDFTKIFKKDFMGEKVIDVIKQAVLKMRRQKLISKN